MAEDRVEEGRAILAQAMEGRAEGRAEGQCLVPCEAPGPVEPTIPDNPAETASR